MCLLLVFVLLYTIQQVVASKNGSHSILNTQDPLLPEDIIGTEVRDVTNGTLFMVEEIRKEIMSEREVGREAEIGLGDRIVEAEKDLIDHGGLNNEISLSNIMKIVENMEETGVTRRMTGTSPIPGIGRMGLRTGIGSMVTI